MTGKQFLHYTFLEKIKDEPAFSVYMGYHTGRRCLVKIKVFHTLLKNRDAFVRDLTRIYRVVESLAHPSMPKCHFVGMFEEQPVVVESFVPGEYLDRKLRSEKFRLPERLQVLRRVAESLLYIGSRNLNHGTVQPASIWVGEGGEVVVENFGLDPLTQGKDPLPDQQQLMKLTEEMLDRPYLDVDERRRAEEYLEVLKRHGEETPSAYLEVLRALEEGRRVPLEPKRQTRTPPAAPILPAASGPAGDERADAVPAPGQEAFRDASIPLTARRTKQLLSCSGIFLIGLFLFAISAFLVSRLFPRLEDVPVPNVVGLSFEEAVKVLEENGLKGRIRHRTFHPDFDEDYVVSQDPAPGMRTKRGREIFLVLSKGKETLQTPNLIGASREDAKKILSQLRLRLGEVQEVEEEGKEGKVVSQSPQPGDAIEPGQPVHLRVGARKKEVEKVVVPDLVGMPLAEARRRLKEAGLGVETERRESPRPEGTVIAQAPAAGSKVTKDQPVSLVVASQPRTLPAPEPKPVRTEAPPALGTETYREGDVEVRIPREGKSQTVRIVVVDASGRRTLYEKLHQPGDRVIVPVRGKGETSVRVYVGGELVREEPL